MTVKAGYVTPLLHVAEVERSLRFYALFGFETIDVERAGGSIGWARMHCEGGAIMFVKAEHSTKPHHDRFLLYLYTPDLAALHSQLVAAGVEAGAINRPEYMPSGEIRLTDPDGYTVLIGHWGEQEHTLWESRRRERLAER